MDSLIAKHRQSFDNNYLSNARLTFGTIKNAPLQAKLLAVGAVSGISPDVFPQNTKHSAWVIHDNQARTPYIIFSLFSFSLAMRQILR